MITGLQKGSSDQKLREVANESGLLILEDAFTKQLQALCDEEQDEDNADGYYRELIPYLVESVFKGSPEFGLGKEIYEELHKKLGMV